MNKKCIELRLIESLIANTCWLDQIAGMTQTLEPTEHRPINGGPNPHHHSFELQITTQSETNI
jgi:hypothetical protein